MIVMYEDDPNMRFEGGRWIYWDGTDWCSWNPGKQAWVSINSQAEDKERTRKTIGFIVIGVVVFASLFWVALASAELLK